MLKYEGGVGWSLEPALFVKSIDIIHLKSGALLITVRWAFVPLGQPISKQAAHCGLFSFSDQFEQNRAGAVGVVSTVVVR